MTKTLLKPTSGTSIEIFTADKPNYTMVFATDSTDALLHKLIRDDMVTYATKHCFKCTTQEVFEAILKTSAK